MKKSIAIMVISLACVALTLGMAAAATDLALRVQPETIQIGAGYNGGQISVSGKVPADAEVLIRVVGKTEDYKLKEKGRALGILWMNLGSVEIANVPDLFLLFQPGDAGGRAEQSAPQWRTLGLGMDSIRKKAKITAKESDTDGLFEEFVKLKEASGLYGTMGHAIRYAAAQNGSKSFQAGLGLPSALPQGTFDVEVFAVRNGAVAASARRQIEAREVGLPAWIANMAFHHGTLYGVLAVTVAILAGLLTGVMFKGEKGAH